MDSLAVEFRNQLARTVQAARRAGETGARNALGTLAVGEARPHESISAAEQDLRRRLRAHGRQLGDRREAETGAQQIDRVAHEVAYEHWHRMLFGRFLAENDLLIEPEAGVPVSLAECEELARERGEDRWTLAGRFAERMLPRIFRGDDPALQVTLAPETRQELERLLEALPAAVFAARDALGWTYQFWQAERKDAVNRSGVKIGAGELPAVTQLFTERYMVLFLLHNTIGAWRAGRILAAHPERAAADAGEEALREAVRLKADGGYDFEYLRFVREPRAGDDAEEPTGPWRPAAGAFPRWPRTAAELRVLDPCCGSGHFLVEALELLVRLRGEEEGLTRDDAIRAVLRDNLFGLEIDPRCTQIAAFNVALAAWKLAGQPIELPPLNLACTGHAIEGAPSEWCKLAGGDERLEGALDHLRKLFEQAPDLGSLIDPRVLDAEQADLYRANLAAAQPLLAAALDGERRDEDRAERAVAAQGMAHAAQLLAGRYTLVVTNVPYLARGKQADVLKAFAREHYPEAKADLATLFVSRIFGWLDKHGAQAVVTPQNWLFLTSYKKLRKALLKQRTWNLVARLGPGAFETIGGHVVNVALNVLSADRPKPDWRMVGTDVSVPSGQRSMAAAEKAALLQGLRIETQRAGAGSLQTVEALGCFKQADFLLRPDSIVSPTHVAAPSDWLGRDATGYQGLSTGDRYSMTVCFWEVPLDGQSWIWLQDPPTGSAFSGRHAVVRASVLRGDAAALRGRDAWRRDGVAFSQTGRLVPARYTGEYFSDSAPVVVPHKEAQLAAVWCFCASGAMEHALRAINPKVSVNNGYFSKVPFDAGHWMRIADEEYPNGLPEPYTDDPTQWVFHGHPCGSVVWDAVSKRTTHAPMRSDATVLQVAVARLLGYRWPAECEADMRLADEMRMWVDRCGALTDFADADGIVCLGPVGGEPPAADRLRQMLAVAYGAHWSGATERRLLATTSDGSRTADSLETWLRDSFFEERCRFFRQRPFIWHVWDGRRDGFHALVNYHRLAGRNGEARRTLDALTYSHLGDWIARQEADRDRGVDGADGRLAAAYDLQIQLATITAGDPPCDLFARWKPLAEQPIGWEPDINDGVRVNIRPFLSVEPRTGRRVGAGILRIKPKIAWNKDRGKELLKPRKRWRPPWVEDDDTAPEVDENIELRPRADYPWFWGCPGDGILTERTDFLGGPDFDGNRWNDLHYTNAVKRAARSRSQPEARFLTGSASSDVLPGE